ASRELQDDLFPYDVRVLPSGKAYVSLWGAAALAVVDTGNRDKPVRYIAVDRHPTALCVNRASSRLYVVNSNADSVSVAATANGRVLERLGPPVAQAPAVGVSPEGLALSDDESLLVVANAHSNSVAVVALGSAARNTRGAEQKADHAAGDASSRIIGLIPTGL